MGKITAEQQERLDYRLAVLQSKMQSIEDAITGRGESYLPIITDESGKISEEKLNAFISDMLESFEHYVEMCPGRVIDEKTRETYRRFLYLAVKTLKDRPNRRCPSVYITEWAQTFGDIVEAAENVDIPGCRSYDEFLKKIYDRYRKKPVYLSELIAWAQEGLKYLKLPGYEEPFIDNLPRDTRMRLCREYAEENGISDHDNGLYLDIAYDPEGFLEGWIKYQEEQAEEDDTPQEIFDRNAQELAEYEFNEQAKKEPYLNAIKSLGETQVYGDDETLRNLTPGEIRGFENEIAFNEYFVHTRPYWLINIVVDDDAYFKNYMEFLKLYFDNDHSMLCEDITNMVDTYLFEHGISAFSLGDRYGLVTYQIDKAQRHIREGIERARNYDRIQK